VKASPEKTAATRVVLAFRVDLIWSLIIFQNAAMRWMTQNIAVAPMA